MRRAIVFTAPLVLAAGWAYHPNVGLVTTTPWAEIVSASPFRWHLSHLLAAVGLGLMGAAAFVVRDTLLGMESVWSRLAPPLIVIGAVLYGYLLGVDGTGLGAVVESGGSVDAYLEETAPWMPLAFIAGGLSSAVGYAGLAMGIRTTDTLSSATRITIATSLVAVAVAFVIPVFVIRYLAAAALLAAFWPLTGPIQHKSAMART